jgi:lysophospholipase L1-like esterase
LTDIHRYTNCAAVTAPSIPDCPQLGMNVRALKFTFTNTAQALTLWHRYVGSTDVLVSYAPASEAVLFQINGVEYDNTSPDGHYQSRGYMRVTGVPISTSINNVRKKSDGSAGSLWIYGTTNAGGVTPRLTAKGGWTSGQILAEYSTLVAPYAPDVVFYIIGANDIGLNVPVAQFKNNVSAFIDLVRGNRPNAIIILISTPPTSSYSKAVAMPYMLAARQLAVARSCSFVDLWAALEKIDPAYYRIDNIHFKPAGDGYVFNVLKKLIFPNVQIESRRMLPEREAYMGVSGTELVMKPEDFSIVFLMGSVPTVFDTSNVYPAAVTTCSYKTVGSMPIFSVVAPYGFTVNSSMSMVFDEPFGRAIKQRLYGEAGEAQFYLANGDVLLDIKGCGLYLTVSFTRDMTVLL